MLSVAKEAFMLSVIMLSVVAPWAACQSANRTIVNAPTLFSDEGNPRPKPHVPHLHRPADVGRLFLRLRRHRRAQILQRRDAGNLRHGDCLLTTLSIDIKRQYAEGCYSACCIFISKSGNSHYNCKSAKFSLP